MFIKRDILANIQEVEYTIDLYSSEGATHYSRAGTLKNIGEVYLHENGLENIMSYVKVQDKDNITCNDLW